MLISEISNRDDVLSTVIKELNGIGIKIRNEKPKQSNVSEIIFFAFSSRKFQIYFLIAEQATEQENLQHIAASA